MAQSTSMGSLRVEGQPGYGQPNQVFITSCKSDNNGNLIKYSCGTSKLYYGILNTDTDLAEGLYLIHYDDIGAGMLIKVEANKKTTIKLEKVPFPTQSLPVHIRVILDLTNPQTLEIFLTSLYAYNSMSQYDFERSSAPNTPVNQKFFELMENAQRPDDLLNVAVKIDQNGIPSYWELFEMGFSHTSDGCQTSCIWAEEKGNFVAVLPGRIYTILDFKNNTIPMSTIHGIHSIPE